jgi:hypothetical protein
LKTKAFSPKIISFALQRRLTVRLSDTLSNAEGLTADASTQTLLRYGWSTASETGRQETSLCGAAGLNGDGRPDLFTANESSDDVTALFGKGDGTFDLP